MSVTIIALNEEKNIARAIESVRAFAQEILVIDSGSTDQTGQVARHLGARVIVNPWRGYGQQKNFAQSQASHDWILNLDADEEVSPELAIEIQQVLERDEGKNIHGYTMPRLSKYLGRWIKHGGWYPNRILRLANRRSGSWSEPQVHEEWVISGAVLPLRYDLLHYPFLNIQDQITTNLLYSTQGAEALRRQGKKKSLLRLILKPIGKFIETFIVKQGFRDGIAGLIISINAAHSIFLKYAYLFDESGKKNESSHY